MVCNYRDPVMRYTSAQINAFTSKNILLLIHVVFCRKTYTTHILSAGLLKCSTLITIIIFFFRKRWISKLTDAFNVRWNKCRHFRLLPSFRLWLNDHVLALPLYSEISSPTNSAGADNAPRRKQRQALCLFFCPSSAPALFVQDGLLTSPILNMA